MDNQTPIAAAPDGAVLSPERIAEIAAEAAPLLPHPDTPGGRFEPCGAKDHIKGAWHEDGSTFYIKIPEELRPHLLAMLENYGPVLHSHAALLASHAALAERVAALEAALLIRDGLRDNAVEVEKKLARVLGVPEGSRLDDEWDEIIEAREAGSVPREVAELAVAMAWGGAMAAVYHGGETFILDAIDKQQDRQRRLCPGTCRDVVARAEAEHAGSTPARRESFAELCADILAWQAATFPHRTPSSITEHLRREAEELAKEPADAQEMADVGLLLIAAADASGVDLLAAIRAKLEKNKQRTWGVPDAHGVVSHVEPTEAEHAKEAPRG